MRGSLYGMSAWVRKIINGGDCVATDSGVDVLVRERAKTLMLSERTCVDMT